jgi:epoxyqueuosine reductase QueG
MSQKMFFQTDNPDTKINKGDDMLLKDIQEKIDKFVLTSPKNIVEKLEALSTSPTSSSSMQIWDLPLVGVASAKDLLWERFKEPDAVGLRHMSPEEWLPGAKSVISYFLPYTKRIREANRIKRVTTTEWLYGRWEGEIFNQALRKYIIDLVEKAGKHALAPNLDERFEVIDLCSNWSERHVAFVAGLGTFSLSRSMITRMGSAGRFGSVIVDFELKPTQRAYTEVDEYCTKCGACAKSCPSQAIDETGKDNEICKVYVMKEKEIYNPRYGCGKCQVGVPCENNIPIRPR